jgi:hypothetical protein
MPSRAISDSKAAAVGRNVGAFLASESNRVEMHGARDVPHLITGSPHVATMAKVYPQRLAAFH